MTACALVRIHLRSHCSSKASLNSDCLCACVSFKTDVAKQHPVQHVLLLLLLLHFNPSMRLLRCVCGEALRENPVVLELRTRPRKQAAWADKSVGV